MQGSFFGLNVSISGLFSSQKNLDIISHNITNATTPGYSRQVGNQRASRAIQMYDGTGMYGTGSEVTSVNRVRDEFLDYKYWSENVASGEWSTKSDLLSEVESTFNEPSMSGVKGSGFSAVFNDFYSSLQELSKSPADPGLRDIVKQRGVTLAKYFNTTATQFEKLQDDINYRIKTKVMEVNSLGKQISDLNRQIYTLEVDGSTANDLRDQRTLLVDKLSKIVNVQANEVVVGKLPNGRDNVHFTVTISGKSLVDHFDYSELQVTQRTTKLNPGEDIANLYDISWKDTGAALKVTGGELRGYLDVRDGNEGANSSPAMKGIPYYQKKLNDFVRIFAMSFNEGIVKNSSGVYSKSSSGHADGYTLGSTTGPSKIRFFTMTGADGKPQDSATFIDTASAVGDIANRYNNMTAKNFAVSEDILDSYKNISASGVAGEQENANILNKLIDLRNNVSLFGEGSAEDFMKSLIANLGIDSQQAETLTDSQKSILTQVENERQSVSGVSLDEELANMIKFQQCYNASARMITTMSQIYDTLINKLGV